MNRENKILLLIGCQQFSRANGFERVIVFATTRRVNNNRKFQASATELPDCGFVCVDVSTITKAVTIEDFLRTPPTRHIDHHLVLITILRDDRQPLFEPEVSNSFAEQGFIVTALYIWTVQGEDSSHVIFYGHIERGFKLNLGGIFT